MNDLLSLLVPIIGLGLIFFLINTIRHINQVNSIIKADDALSKRYPKAARYLHIAPYYIYIPCILMSAFFLFQWQMKRQNIRDANLKIKAIALTKFDTAKIHVAPDPLSIKTENDAKLIAYGRDLIAHTADYLGPDGIVKPISNGMNCQNCHLQAGSLPFGNNYMAVAATYPKFRARSGTAETIYKRVNDCFQRSLNGQALDSTSHEMLAIEAYIKWLGQAVPKGKTPKGAGLMKLTYLNRAANPDSGRVVFIQKCQSCHGLEGQGLPIPEGNGRKYPPLWGNNSYNEAAGLYRLSTFAGYVKANMPLGASYDNPQLSDTEAWDLAAYINSQPRPKHPFLQLDWPKIDGKPIDHPFGPFVDTFSEVQHKFGPFQPIVDWQNKKKAEKEVKK
jgi:thiosulfate dehydrogenase